MAFLLPYLICFSPFLLFLTTTAQTYHNITLGSSLIAGDPSSSWTSPSKDFAFGFREVQSGNFLVAIWFDSIPDKTITWSANRDQLAPSGSKVELTSDRGLVLTDPSGRELWRSKWTGGDITIAHGAMLDKGNFVLANQASAVIWQSFDEPTDTVLPTQVLNLGAQLIARYSATNYSSGRFMLQLGNDGNLALYTTNFPLFDSINTFYLSSSSQGSGYQLRFNQTGSLHLVAKNGTIIDELIDDSVSNQDFYQRAIIEYDGVLRHYVYPKGQSSGSTGWSVKSFIAENICIAVIQQTGSGVCGFNSYCQMGNDKRPYCSCPPGYTFIDPDNQISGCRQNFTAQSCRERSDANQFDFKVLINVDWPLSDYEHFENVTKDWCRNICLLDCFCAVSVFREGGDCWKKKLPLSNGKNDTSVGRTTFIKVRKNSDFIRKSKHKSSHKEWAFLLVTAMTVLIACLAVFVLKKKNREYKPVAKNMGSCLEFSFNSIRVTTNDFSASNKLGKGGFGAVYKGTLANGGQIAVKRLLRHSARGDMEFRNEVQLMARVHHKNLIGLIGYCIRGQERILIYELAINGSLDRFLYDEMRRELLHWKIRYNIIEGIARGMLYLHEDSQLRIIHRDLKASNVLLDESMTPKISDFGTARLFVGDQESASKVVGTYGYMAPEYLKYGKISVKVDVFSFGVLLLELLAGKRNFASKSQMQIDHLPSKAWKYWREGKLHRLIDPIIYGTNGQIDEIIGCLHIGLLCVQDDPACRPTTNLVILMLEGRSQSLPPPLKPAYFVDIGDDDDDGPITSTKDNGSFILTPYEPKPNANQEKSLLSSSPSTKRILSANMVSITQPYPEPR